MGMKVRISRRHNTAANQLRAVSKERDALARDNARLHAQLVEYRRLKRLSRVEDRKPDTKRPRREVVVKAKEKHNPGSDEALGIGCLCPVLDNCRGRGISGDGEQFGWWTSSDCPVHGDNGDEKWFAVAD